MTIQEPLMTIHEVAEFLKVTPTTIRRWTDGGQLKCYRVGKRNARRFDKQDVLHYLHKNKDGV